MHSYEETTLRLARIPDLNISEGALLSRRTRFGIGGPADLYVETSKERSFMEGLRTVRASGHAYTVIGDGTNLIVADGGFRGIVLRFTADAIRKTGLCVEADAGAELQHLVDYCIDHGLKGIETMTGIPGSVGAAVYGNAGAYGHSIQERVESVRYFDGEAVRLAENSECEFAYRESAFKRHKEWVVLSARLRLDPAEASELTAIADGILKIRNDKYPPSMRCAGSIFKNLLLNQISEPLRSQIPAGVIREGKVPAAYFLDVAGAKGMKDGDIHVADYHANLIYNAGAGTARQVQAVIQTLKAGVLERFGLELEEEVQYL